MQYKFIGLLIGAATVATSLCRADDREELVSYLELHESNWASIKRMDVLVRTDTSREPAALPGFTETTHERIILDWDANRFTYVRVASRFSLGSKEKKESVETGFVIKDGKYRSFLASKRNQPSKQLGSFEQVFDEHRMPDLRISMFMKVSHGSSRTWTEHKANVFHVHPQQATRIKSLGNVIGQLRYEMLSANHAGLRWNFDLEQLMPVRTEWFIESPKGDQSQIVGTEILKWSNIGGIFVPITIQGDFVDRQNLISPEEMQSRLAKLPPGEQTPEAMAKVAAGFFVDATECRDMRLHWAAVNKKLRDEYFDFDLIDKPDKFVLLANPVTLGASELLDQSNSKR